MRRMNASLCSSRLLRFLSGGRKTGQIHSVFENATNIEMEDGFIFALLPEKIPPNPRSVILPENEWAAYHSVVPRVGEEVLLEEKKLEIPHKEIRIGFGSAKSWDPLPSLMGSPSSINEIRQKVRVLERFLCHNTQNGRAGEPFRERLYHVFENIPYTAFSEASSNVFRKRLFHASEELFLRISNNHCEDLSAALDDLIGLGPGLTPSGDDLLTGVMGAGIYYSLICPAICGEVKKVNSQVAMRARKRTTVFGEMMLSDASREELVQPLGQLLQRLLFSKKEGNLLAYARRVTAIGDSSGKDMLAGVILGMEAFTGLGQKLQHAMQ